MTVLTEDERKAMQWLETWASETLGNGPNVKHANTLKRMLARGGAMTDVPKGYALLPEEPDEEALNAMRDAAYTNALFIGSIYHALYAHLTAPKTKEVEVWRVESAYHGHTRIWQSNNGSKSDADKMATYLASDGHTCIRVTGPHKQQIPA